MMRFDAEAIKQSLGCNVDLTELCSSARAYCIVAEINNVILGYMCCEVDSDVAQVVDIRVAEEVRGAGIGRALLMRTKLAIHSDCSLEAVVDIGDPAIKFFSSLGFKAVKSLPNDTVLMREGWRFKVAPALEFRGVGDYE